MIENSNFQSNRVSAFIDVTIPYDSDVSLAKQILVDLIENHPLYVPDTENDPDTPVVTVFIRELTLQGAVLRSSMWCRNVSESFEACSDIREQLITIFPANDIRISTNIGPPPPKERTPSVQSHGR